MNTDKDHFATVCQRLRSYDRARPWLGISEGADVIEYLQEQLRYTRACLWCSAAGGTVGILIMAVLRYA
jgi:hypothetical protein